VGCQRKTKKAWKKVTEKQTLEMGDENLVIWKMKDALLQL